MIADGTWTLGVKIGLPLAAVGFIALAVWAAFVIRYAADKPHPYDLIETRAARVAWAIGFTLLPFIFAGMMLLAYWPINAEYHQYRTHSGTVATISSRLVSAGDSGGTDQKFVVTLTGSTQQLGITDTRAALLHRGDHVVLQCIRVYDYGSNDAGYDCKWGQ